MNRYKINESVTIQQDEINNLDIQIIKHNEEGFVVSFKNKIYHVKQKDFKIEKKSFTFNIEGQNFEVAIQEPIDILIDQLGFLVASKHSVKDIRSPMPGLVVSVDVEVGAEVIEGDRLLSLEAMKMENILKSPGNGKIKCIHIQKGDAVDKNQLLIEFE